MSKTLCDYAIHPAADLFPMMSDDELQELADDIKEHGQQVPIILLGGAVLDGRNRLKACRLAGVEPKTEVVISAEIGSPTKYVLSLNLKRRHLNSAQKDVLAVEVAPLLAAEAKERQREGAAVGGRGGKLPTDSVGSSETSASKRAGEAMVQAAKLTGAGRDGAIAMARIAKSAPEVVAAVKSGAVATVADAKRLAAMPSPKRAEVMAKVATKVADEAKASGTLRSNVDTAKATKTIVAEAVRQDRVAKITEISRGNTELAANDTKYPVILADPPWRYDFSPTESRAIENQYPTMSIDEICALPVTGIATPDAVLFMWATSPKLVEAMRLIGAWGFTYKTNMVWVKDKIGMGYYAREKHELLLIATRGNLPVPEPANRPASAIIANRGEHSAKPEEFRDAIERMYPEFAKVELFCRSPRKGWSAWGNQSDGKAA